MKKMSVEQFKDKVDGLVNDYCERISDEREFKTGILELLLAVTEPFLTGKEEPAPSASTNKPSDGMCPECYGSGVEDADGNRPIKCSMCNGVGYK